jgi:RHS repeat-associated protein
MPFGGQRGSGGISTTAYKFTDQELDAETNLYNYDARLYDPVVGRFVSADSVVPDKFDSQSWNAYSYCQNNPIKYNDPSGHSEVAVAMEFGWGIALIEPTPFGEVAMAVVSAVVAGVAIAEAICNNNEDDGVSESNSESENSTPGDPNDDEEDEDGKPTKAPKSASNFSRALQPGDLGIKGKLSQLKGIFSIKDGQAVARIDMIEGKITNPNSIIKNLTETARSQGATSLRIEGTIANERLYNVLAKRYGLQTSGATDFITIPLKK